MVYKDIICINAFHTELYKTLFFFSVLVFQGQGDRNLIFPRNFRLKYLLNFICCYYITNYPTSIYDDMY